MPSMIAAALLSAAILPAQVAHAGALTVDAAQSHAVSSAANAAALRVYTGFVAPVRIAGTPQALGDRVRPALGHQAGEVVVAYTVDTAGVPQNVHVVTPLNLYADAQVVSAVKQYRYQPGTLNGKPLDTPVTLHVAFESK